MIPECQQSLCAGVRGQQPPTLATAAAVMPTLLHVGEDSHTETQTDDSASPATVVYLTLYVILCRQQQMPECFHVAASLCYR